MKPMDVPPSNENSQAKESSQTLTAKSGELLGRLLHETLFVACFIGFHWGLKIFQRITDQSEDWAVVYLVRASKIMAVAAFTFILGAELIAGIVAALRSSYARVFEARPID